MKKWVIEVGGKQYVCDLVRAYPMTFQLHLFANEREFMVTFDKLMDYADAQVGTKKPVYITNKSKTSYKHGFAVFKHIIK